MEKMKKLFERSLAMADLLLVFGGRNVAGEV